MNDSILSRLKKYTAMAVAGATAATVMQADVANADILYSGLQNISVPANFDGIYIDFDRTNARTDQGETQTPAGVFGLSGSTQSGSELNFFYTGLAPDGSGWIFLNPDGGIAGSGSVVVDGGAPAELAIGTLIDGTSTFVSDGFQTNEGSYFVGVQSDSGNFGWVQFAGIIDDNGNGTGEATVVDWAFEDTGAAIAVGATGVTGVPEPGSLALLGLGATAFVGRRRRS